MNAVLLKRNGAIYHQEKKIASDILAYLGAQIALEDGYTLRSFFRMFDQYPLLVQLNTFLPTHTAQYRDGSREKFDSGVSGHLEFSKTIEMIGVPQKRLEIYNSFSGVNGNEVFEIRSLPLDQLLDLTVTLGRLKHIIFGDRVDIFEFETVFTLFEFIDGIAWALSFQVIPTRCEIRR
jgi:hypothetical protein